MKRLLTLAVNFFVVFGSSINNRNHTSPINSEPLHNFIAELVQTKFSNCSSIVVTESKFQSNNIYNKIALPGYSINLRWNETLNGTLVKLKFSHEHRLFASRKLSSPCTIVIALTDQISTNLLQQMRQILCPNFMPILRKDEDHFIFVTNPKNHKKLLRMKALPNKIKFKIAVGIEKSNKGSSEHILISTNDFFGGPEGSPKLIQFKVKEFNQTTGQVREYFPDFLWDLNGALLRIVLPNTKSLVEAYPTPFLGNAKKGRWKYLIEEFLQVKFNFTYNMFLSTDINGTKGAGGTGLLLKNLTWVGATGDILYGRCDIGVGIANTEKRNQYIGFTDAHFHFGWLTFVTGQPVKVFSPQAIFWSFDLKMWLSIILACIFGFAIIPFFKTLSTRICPNQIKMDYDTKCFKNLEIRVLLAPFVELDYVKVPDSGSLQFFVGFWSFFAIIITTLYRSKLVTLLAFPVVVILPQTFSELAFSDFQIAFMKHGDSALNTLKASSDPVYTNLVDRMEIITGVGLECLEKVVKFGKTACIAYDFDIDYLIERNFTDKDSRELVIAPRGRTYNLWLGIVTEAYSIYKPNFGKMLSYTMPFHLDQIWNKMDIYRNLRLPKHKWWKDTNQLNKLTPSEEIEDSDNLTLKHILGVFYMLAGCVFTALVVFITERIHFYVVNRI